jgi:cyclophilin family peptidyl-prolyl cis-trans isomerase
VHAATAGRAKLDGRDEPPATPPQARAEAARLDSLPTIDLGPVFVRLTTAHGEVRIELDGDRYPRTVANFLKLVDTGFYSRGVFHRVVPAFVVQGGCPRGDGWGDAGYSIPCEYGDLRYDDAGVVGMAHAGKDTGGSQFFITHVPVPRLDGRYTAFGRVRDGMAVVDQIVRGDWFRIERATPPVESASRR